MDAVTPLRSVALAAVLALPLAAADPNVILILADDQGWTGTSVEMIPGRADSKSDFYQTPSLERLAKDGMRFSDAYAPHPNCSPTRLAIQTGKSPAHLRMTDIIGRNSGPFYEGQKLIPPKHINEIPANETTIAEFIKAQKPNYVTGYFGKWHLAGGGPAEHGYDFSDGETTNAEGSTPSPDPKRTPFVTARAVEFLERNHDKPFFLQISYYAVHLPMRAFGGSIERYRKAKPGERHKNPEHAAMTDDLDGGVGLILQTVERLGLSGKTYVIYTSDNGSYLDAGGERVTSNRPLAGQKASTWEGGIRVPLLVSGPGIASGIVSRVPVTGLDLFPTIRELVEIFTPLPPGLEGGSFAGILYEGGQGEVRRWRPDLVWHFPHYQVDKGVSPMSSVRLGEWKLTRFYETGEVKLFNLNDDIGEEIDLSKKNPEKAKELEGLLTDHLKALDAPMPTPNPAWK
jgi:arylsulfatase A-like enzyme